MYRLSPAVALVVWIFAAYGAYCALCGMPHVGACLGAAVQKAVSA